MELEGDVGVVEVALGGDVADGDREEDGGDGDQEDHAVGAPHPSRRLTGPVVPDRKFIPDFFLPRNFFLFD